MVQVRSRLNSLIHVTFDTHACDAAEASTTQNGTPEHWLRSLNAGPADSANCSTCA
jgi:hypothetical protein